MTESNQTSEPLRLLSGKWKFAGWLLLIFGTALAVVRFQFGIKVELFDIKVFALFSYYLETKYFAIISNNITEEIAGLLILSGLVLIAFAREKAEAGAESESARIAPIRLKALQMSLFYGFLLNIFAIVFIYGIGFIYYLVFNLTSPLLLYIIIFKCRLAASRNKKEFGLREDTK